MNDQPSDQKSAIEAASHRLLDWLDAHLELALGLLIALLAIFSYVVGLAEA